MPAPKASLQTSGTNPVSSSRANLEAMVNAVAQALWDQLGAIATGLEPAGNWSAAAGSFPSGSTKGTYYVVSAAGTVNGQAFAVGDWLVPLKDGASTGAYAENWFRADYSKVVPRNYETVQQLRDSLEPSRGTGSLWQVRDLIYEEVLSGEVLTNGAGVKLRLLAQQNTIAAKGLDNDPEKIGAAGRTVIGMSYARQAPGNGLTITANGTGLRDAEIDMAFATVGSGGHGVVALTDDVRLERVAVKGIGNSVSEAGTGLISYTADQSHRERVEFIDYHVTGDITSVDTNGALLEDVWYGRLRGGYAGDIVSFAHELKHNARYNISSDLIAVNSGFALGYGQSEAGVDGADFNVAYGWVGHKVDVGLIVGEGYGNIFGLQITDGTDSPLTTAGAERYGVHWSTDSQANTHLGAATFGPLDYAVRDRGSRNYTAIASHDTAPNVVTFQVGSTQNHVDVLHSGSRTSVMSAYTNGSTLSDANANTINSPHTGERIGSRSGKFWDRLANTGAVPLSSQQWVKEGGPHAVEALCVDTSDTGNAGIQINRGATANYAGFYAVMSGAYWLLRVGGASIARWAATALYPETNGTVNLGLAGNRWATVYAATGTINTSDARLKTPVKAMNGAEIAASKDLGREIGTFQWLSSIDAKGKDAARIHVGVTVQRVIEIMQAHGLDPMRYGMVCYDEWEGEAPTEDTDGREAGNVYSLRMDQLALFIARGQAARLDALEAGA